jgi:hypothetical protein
VYESFTSLGPSFDENTQLETHFFAQGGDFAYSPTIQEAIVDQNSHSTLTNQCNS